MSAEIEILSIAAASIGFLHTVFGPDHYIPFVMLSKAGKWSMTKTILITILSGLGHVLSSAIIGLIGIVLGIAVNKLEIFEEIRGNIAGWLLIVFGLLYFIWGLRQSFRNNIHSHTHSHENGGVHSHNHNHNNEHLHPHENDNKNNINAWAIFAIFVFGPCEPLIPLLMYPAVKVSWVGLTVVTIVFSVVTIATMLTIVFFTIKGINLLPMAKLEKHMHAIAGVLIIMSGLAIQFLGL